MNVDQKAINYLKSITADTISFAGSGHTGTALGASTILYALFKDHLFVTRKNPKFINHDRFAMSAGHACGLLYSLFYMFDLGLKIDDLQKFRKCGSKTPGHPEISTNFVDVATGPLGQGIANAVGLAIASKFYSKKLGNGKYINNKTYAFAGDGCLMEGVALEAVSLAGTLGLDNLILLYDRNNVTIDGMRDVSNIEDIEAKFKSMNWDVITVKNGHDYNDCTNAIEKAKHKNKPVIIIFDTIIGVGTKLAGLPAIHAHPLNETELAEFKQSLGIDTTFFVPNDILDFCRKTSQKNDAKYDKWVEMVNCEKDEYIKNILISGKIDCDINFKAIEDNIKDWQVMSGRDISSKILNEVAKYDSLLIGGAADVASSTKTKIFDSKIFSNKAPENQNIYFGIREHAMSSICNGISLFAGGRCFESTFMAFSNYMIPAIRMASIMRLPVISIFTHDSINIGQDGITHQPIEQIGTLRSIVNNFVFRPAEKNETLAAFKFAYENNFPTNIIMSKSKLDIAEKCKVSNAEKGGYVIFEKSGEKMIEIFATGSEVSLAINVAKNITGYGVRVISMPCEKLFDMQSQSYKRSVLIEKPILKISIEASNDMMWYKYIGENGLFIGVNKYLCSGPGDEIYKKAGFETNTIIEQIYKALSK